MTAHRIWFILRSWARNLVSLRAVAALLGSFGALWLLVEITTFYLSKTPVPDWLREHWWLFALVGVAVAATKCWPQTSVSCKLNGRDVSVEIAVGDLFSFPGALIVASNTTFDTRVSTELIAANSIQGAFTTKYYSNEAQLDAELAVGLSTAPAVQLDGPRKGKSHRYPVGTTVRLNPKGRTAYFVAISDINEHGVAEGTFEDLRISLAELWVFVGSRGLKETLVTPVLGTGYSRLTQTRAEVVREILTSFVAACSERVFSERLTIVLSPADMAKYDISLEELGTHLRYLCEFTQFVDSSRRASGRPA